MINKILSKNESITFNNEVYKKATKKQFEKIFELLSLDVNYSFKIYVTKNKHYGCWYNNFEGQGYPTEAMEFIEFISKEKTKMYIRLGGLLNE